MTGQTLTGEMIQTARAFHGHSCPGLAIGLRAAEICLERVGGHSEDEELVAIVETDMCGVDGIQSVTGCTFGKGNLIHLDYGKNAFTFHNRTTGAALRVVARPGAFASAEPDASITAAEIKAARVELIMAASLDVLFDIREVDSPPPRPARVMASLKCDDCGERMMETRSRRFDGRTLCIPCFRSREKRLD